MSQLISKFMRWSFLYLSLNWYRNVTMEWRTFHPHHSECVRETNRANALAMHKRVNAIPISNWNGLVLRSHAYRISVFMCHIVHVSWTKMFSQRMKANALPRSHTLLRTIGYEMTRDYLYKLWQEVSFFFFNFMANHCQTSSIYAWIAA